MSLSIVKSTVGEITVGSVLGRVTLGEASAQLRGFGREILEDGCTKLVLNFSDCVYMDSSGLAELVFAYTAFRNRGGNLVIAEPSEKFSLLMKLTKCNKIFKIFESTEEAVAFLQSEITEVKQ
jgi:anti-sigma B factor antagonist